MVTAAPTRSQSRMYVLDQRRIDHAYRRYLSALRALAQVRKLTLPVVQINIAKKQVNIAAPAAVDPNAYPGRVATPAVRTRTG